MPIARTKYSPILLLVVLQAAHPAFAAPADRPVSIPSAAASVASTGTGTAGGASTPAALSATDELATLQSEIPVLRARAEIAKLQAEINGANVNGEPGTPSTTPARGISTVVVPAAQQATADVDIKLVSVAAWDGRYVATLQIEGRAVPVHEGDVIGGGWRVTRIAETRVELDRGGHSRMVGL